MTPTMKDVAGWLRRAAMSCDAFGEHCTAEEFRQHAAQVEAMTIIKTCETCINFDAQFNDCLSSFDSSFENGADIEHCGTKFGCIHHKDKPQPPVKK